MKRILLALLAGTLFWGISVAQTSVTLTLTCNDGNVTNKKIPGMCIKIGDELKSVNSNGEATFSLNPGTYSYDVYYGSTIYNHAKMGEITVNNQSPQNITIDLGYEIKIAVTEELGKTVNGSILISIGQESTNWLDLTNGQRSVYLRSETYDYILNGKINGEEIQDFRGTFSISGQAKTINIDLPALYLTTISFTGIPSGTNMYVTVSKVNSGNSTMFNFTTPATNQIKCYLANGNFVCSVGGSYLYSDHPFTVNGITTKTISLANYYKVTINSNTTDYVSMDVYKKGGDFLVTDNAGQATGTVVYLDAGDYYLLIDKNPLLRLDFTVTGNQTVNFIWPRMNTVQFNVKNNKGEDIWYGYINTTTLEGTYSGGTSPEKPVANSGLAQGKGKSVLKIPAGTYRYIVEADGLQDRIGIMTIVDSDEVQHIDVIYDTDKVVGKVRNSEGQGVYGSLVIYPVSTDQQSGRKTLLTNNIRLVFLEPDGSFKEELEIGEYYFLAKGELLGYLNAYYKKGSKPSPLSWEEAELVSVSYEDSVNIYLAKEGEIASGSISFGGTVKEGSIKSTMARPVAYATVILYGKAKTKSTTANDYEPLLKTEVDDAGNFSFGKGLTQDYLYRLRVELATYTMESDFEIDPAADGATVYNINFLVDDAKQLISGDYQSNHTGFETSEFSEIILYPNPATDRVRIEVNAVGPYIIKIYNTLGQLMMSANGTSPEVIIDLTGLRQGIYFVKIEADRKTRTLKLLKN